MSSNPSRRRVETCAVACALLLTTSGTALAAEPGRGALAQERYYSSYGSPTPVTRPVTPHPSEDMPWPAIALAAAGPVLVAGTTMRRRKARARRRLARTPA